MRAPAYPDRVLVRSLPGLDVRLDEYNAAHEVNNLELLQHVQKLKSMFLKKIKIKAQLRGKKEKMDFLFMVMHHLDIK